MSTDTSSRTEGTTQATEVSRTLAGPTPRTLGVADQSAFWVNLGVSLLGFTGASTVLMPAGYPKLPVLAAVLATVVGTVLGSIMLGLSAVPGARTQAPAMVLLRGLFGARLSYVPTVLNVLQLIGWGTFELLAIAQGAEAIFGGGPRWLYVVITGVLTTALTIRPLGAVRVLRRYVTVAVAISMVYLFVQVLRNPLPDLTSGSWQGFWVGSDAALAVAVSFIPLAADYSRHAKSVKGSFGAAAVGYSVSQVLCYLLGLLVLAESASTQDPYQPFLAIPLGALFFGVIVLREVDQSFADTYSTGVSLQNLLPNTDRRILTVAIGVLTTVLALAMNIGQYASFLTLIGSVFVPMFGVLAADYFGHRRKWDLSVTAPSRWPMALSWLVGFVVYQMINPGEVGAWSAAWHRFDGLVGFAPQSWMSASLFSFVIAAAVAYAFGFLPSRRNRALPVTGSA